MNLAGYVPLRRSVFEHTISSRLSNTECLVFILLVALADRRTGSGTINASSLRHFLPELSRDAAKRVLCSLESKGYVFRDIVPFSPKVYHFWVNKYQPTDGKYKLLQLDISKALETRDVKDIQYVDPALEGALEGAPETALEGAHYYKKREERKEKGKYPSTEQDVCASLSDSRSTSLSDTGSARGSVTCGSACAPHDALHDAPQDVHHSVHQDIHHALDTELQERSPEEAGLRWSGYDGAYLDTASGRPLTFDEAERRMGRGTR